MPDRKGLRRALSVFLLTTSLSGALVGTSGSASAETTDAQAPSLGALVAEPATVDASQQAVPVVVTARLVDAGSGTTRALVRLGGALTSVELNPLSGTAGDGQWSGVAVVPAGTPAGEVDAELTLTDAAGNSTVTGTSALESVDGPMAAPTVTTMPPAPSVTSVSAGDAAGTLSWSAPGADGVEPPYAFVITATQSGRHYVLPGSARSATVGRLTNGTATSFTVAAVNSAGSGAESAASAVVTPRLPGTLNVLVRPTPTVVSGTATTVAIDLRTAGDVSVADRTIELLAMVRPSTTWRSMAKATTNSYGQAVLKAVLPATSALQVRHIDDVIHAPSISLGSVGVSTRVTALPRASRIRQGGTVTVNGGVAPAHPVGSPVRLQARTTKGWVTVANGRMTTSTAYSVGWRPASVGSYTLRVLKPADTDHLTGGSAAFAERVDPEIALDVARAIRANSRITLADVHESRGDDGATAQDNLIDLAAGRWARRSSYGSAPGGSTPVDVRVLKAIRRMGQVATVTVSEVAGGSHAGGSGHYQGKAVDITYVNGRHVGGGASYQLVIDACRAYGAVQVFSPSNDPYGGHGNHVHCGW